MVTKNAERQAKYREKHLKSEEGTLSRLNMMVDFKAKIRLERLANYYAVTKKEMLERILFQTETSLTDEMQGDLVNLYFDKKLRITA